MSRAETADVFVTDISGQELLDLGKSYALSQGHNQMQFSIADLSTGLYLLNIKTTDGLVTRKIIKQ
jgi:hypothetical protein